LTALTSQQIEEEEAVEDQEEVKLMKMKMKKTLTGGTCTAMKKFGNDKLGPNSSFLPNSTPKV